MNRQSRKYYKKIFHMFPSHTRIERAYLKQLKQFIITHSQRFPEDCYDNYVEKIGEPQDIILSYYEKLGNQYVISQMKITQFMRNFIIAFCVIVTVLLGYYTYFKYQEYLYFNEDYYFEETITDVIE